MKYTKLSGRERIELNKVKKEPINLDTCFHHPTYFAHHFLGMTPYKYQHLILQRFRSNSEKNLKNDRIIVVKGRQMGLSFCFAWLGIWAAYWNKFPSGPFKDTKVAIVSRSDTQARKLMAEIQKLIWQSPQNLGDFVKKDQKQHRLTKTEIHFEHGWIKCFPPTDAILGETLDLLIVDEAAMVEDEVFNTAMRPTISKSNGKIILSSTPRGQKGFFFETFDPFDLRDKHHFARFWFHWKMCEDPMQIKIIKQEISSYKATGNLKKIEQEYNGNFTVDEEAFFEDQQIEKGIDNTLETEYENHDVPVSIGIDYGGVDAETAITVVGKYPDGLKLLFQFGKADFDYNLLTDPSWENSIQNLQNRYRRVQNFVVDDCAAGTQTNRWLQKEGYPVVMFNFKTDAARGERNRGYFIFRSNLHKGNIKYPNNRKLVSEMKSIQEIQMEINTRIKAPRNYRDDLIDSFMMACFPFLSDDGVFNSTVIDYQKVNERMQKNQSGPRTDPEWDKLHNSEYDFLLNETKVGRPTKLDKEGVRRK